MLARISSIPDVFISTETSIAASFLDCNMKVSSFQSVKKRASDKRFINMSAPAPQPISGLRRYAVAKV